MAPWWTDADQAEQDAMVAELVRVVADHKQVCFDCKVFAWQGCPQVGAAIAVVIDWNLRRHRVSKARWLRGGEDLREFANLLGFNSADVKRILG